MVLDPLSFDLQETIASSSRSYTARELRSGTEYLITVIAQYPNSLGESVSGKARTSENCTQFKYVPSLRDLFCTTPYSITYTPNQSHSRVCLHYDWSKPAILLSLWLGILQLNEYRDTESPMALQVRQSLNNAHSCPQEMERTTESATKSHMMSIAQAMWGSLQQAVV